MSTNIATTETMTTDQPSRIADRIPAYFRKAGKSLQKNAVQTVLDHEMEPMLAEMYEVFRRRVESKLVLADRGTMSITISESHDPNAFFQTRPGLYVWDDFRSLIVSKAKPVDAGTVFKLDHALLTKDMTDEEIETALPKDHLFDESDVCAIVAKMISEQSNGKEGKLLNNGYANLFYTCSCVVDVYWNAGYLEWNVLTWQRVALRWDAGYQVFSPATAT